MEVEVKVLNITTRTRIRPTASLVSNGRTDETLPGWPSRCRCPLISLLSWIPVCHLRSSFSSAQMDHFCGLHSSYPAQPWAFSSLLLHIEHYLITAPPLGPPSLSTATPSSRHEARRMVGTSQAAVGIRRCLALFFRTSSISYPDQAEHHLLSAELPETPRGSCKKTQTGCLCLHRRR